MTKRLSRRGAEGAYTVEGGVPDIVIFEFDGGEAVSNTVSARRALSLRGVPTSARRAVSLQMVRSRWRRRWLRYPGFVVLAVVGCAALPRIASAAQEVAVTFGPLRVRAYELLITAYPRQLPGHGQAGSPATVTVVLARSAGKPIGQIPGLFQYVQSHGILLRRGVRVDVAANLRSARVSANLRRYGKIDLVLAGARPTRTRGCPSTVQAGEATGTFRLVPGGRYFGTIVHSSLPAAIGNTSGCQTSAAIRHTFSNLGLVAHHTSRNGTEREIDLEPYVPWTISLIRPDGDVRLVDSIGANAPPSAALHVQPDLSSATLRAFGPFLTGIATYTADSPLMNGETSGTVSGTLTAKFDSPGPVQITRPALAAALTGP